MLVADDNTDAADTLAMMLQLLGHDVRIARDGREAVAVADAFRPQIALLDIGMPVMDGLEACRELRSRECGAEMRIIALSGWSQEADKQRSREAGFDRHLVKPVAPEVLQEVFRDVTA